MPTLMRYPQGTFAVGMLTSLVRTTSSRAAATALPATTWTQRAGVAAARNLASSSSTSAGPVDKMESFDNYYEKDKLHKQPGDPNKRDFTYFVLGGARFIYASAARLVALKFVSTMSASADVLALANAEFDIGDIPLGQGVTVKWRGKPIFIRHRTPAEIDRENAVNMNELRDAEADTVRAQRPEWLIIVGICTHLGCVPIANAGEYHGWFCPCHGSHYDVSGRIRKGPAPLNMEIPPYKFLADTKVLIG